MNMITFDNRKNTSQNGLGPLTKAKNEKRAGEVTIYSSPDKIGKLVANRMVETVKLQLVK